MSKPLKAVGTIAGAVALVAVASTGVGIALGGAGMAFLGVNATTIATFASIAATAANIGSQALAKPPNARGSVSQILIQPDAPQPYVMGEGYFAGVLRHDTGYGPTLDKVPNPYRWMPVVYSGGGPVQSISPRVDYGAIGGYYSGFLYTDTQMGATPEPDALTPEWSGAPGWGTASKLSGQAAIGWNLKFDKKGKVFANGVPLLGAYGQWVRVYDPRKDSTYPGGSGSHRLGDESTYEWSENPALHAGTYAFGRYQNGKRTIGMGLPADGIDWTVIAAWANVCEANGWTMFGVVYEPGDRWANLKDICIAGGGEPIAGGILSFRYSAPVVALDTITADDLTDDAASVMAMQSFRDRINTAVPKYRSPQHNWELVDAEPKVVPTFLTEDGEEKREVWPFNFVKNADQAAQLATYRIWDSRELAPVTLPCKPRMRHYRPGECLELDLPELGLNTTAIILNRTIDPTAMSVTLELMGETPAKHAYCLGETGTPPPTPAIGQTPEERDAIAAAANGSSQALIVGSPTTSIEAKTTGEPTEGELPLIEGFTLFDGGDNVTTSATWSVEVQSGTAAVSMNSNLLTISALDTNAATVRVAALYDGEEIYFDHRITKRIASADINTGSGGTSSSDNTFTSFSTTTYSVVSDPLNITTGSTGEVTLAAPLNMKVGSSAPVGSYTCNLRWQQDVGGTWTDVGTEHASGVCTVEPGGLVVRANARANETLTLTAATDYRFRLTAKANESDGQARFLTGTASASG